MVSSAGWRGAVILLSGEKPEVRRGNSLTAWAEFRCTRCVPQPWNTR
ncbi:MAG: hypothetical protein ACLSG5_14390 [Oscillospiraceae bacterium]